MTQEKKPTRKGSTTIVVRVTPEEKQVIELAKINGDLGRLGGLLKLWLTDDVRTAHFGAATIRATLARIEDSQREMINVMAKVMHPRTER